MMNLIKTYLSFEKNMLFSSLRDFRRKEFMKMKKLMIYDLSKTGESRFKKLFFDEENCTLVTIQFSSDFLAFPIL